jgi:hypothetical protein
MNRQELINAPRILFPVGTEVLIRGKIVGLKVLDDRFVENVVKLDYGEQIIAPNDAIYVKDEPETGHADEAPRYVKNILARLRELPVHDREVWLKAIMSEFEQDFSHAKWREGYEQGKLEGMVGREKVTIPKFVADWIEVCKEHLTTSLYTAMNPNFMKENNQSFDLILWIQKTSNQELFARAWIFGYEVEEEKRYTVVMKETKQPLYYNALDEKLFFSMGKIASHFTQQQLEKLNFGWVFDCEGLEVQEVE